MDTFRRILHLNFLIAEGVVIRSAVNDDVKLSDGWKARCRHDKADGVETVASWTFAQTVKRQPYHMHPNYRLSCFGPVGATIHTEVR